MVTDGDVYITRQKYREELGMNRYIPHLYSFVRRGGHRIQILLRMKLCTYRVSTTRK
jgi:hypothetical protein